MVGIWRAGNQENWWSMGEITGFLGGASGKEPTCQSRRQEMRFQSLGLEDILKEGTATHYNILAWRIPWTEEPGGLQSIGSQRVGHNWSNVACIHRRNQIPQITSQTFPVRSFPCSNVVTQEHRTLPKRWHYMENRVFTNYHCNPAPAGPKHAHSQADTSQVGGWMNILWRNIYE